ncbi:COG4705 family protein [Chryseobacterium sp. 22543]|uniref:COG4705 family protein n=1 Tax=Chryseobacterium sp. 22543 TaxID=3453940 RepID=UPI003F834E21
MRTANKVAAVTLLFWLMKIVATTLGETLGDFISMTLNLGYVVGILVTLMFFILILSVQLRVKKYIPAVYWVVIIGTTTLGTEISDFIDRTLKTGYLAGSLILFLGLLTSLFLWYRKYKNLEVYPIFERNKEFYYWTAILFSNSLGTAFGDFLSDNLGLGYMSGALFTGLIVVVVVALHYFTKINHVVLFWIAFVFTRPFGATFGDLLTKPLAKGGLDLGTLNASLISLTLMVFMIIISQRKHSRELPLQKE